MTSQDVVEDFLNSFRRTLEADPDQRWINSFNTRAMIVSILQMARMDTKT